MSYYDDFDVEDSNREERDYLDEHSRQVEKELEREDEILFQ
jgi:hypothetical protein